MRKRMQMQNTDRGGAGLAGMKDMQAGRQGSGDNMLMFIFFPASFGSFIIDLGTFSSFVCLVYFCVFFLSS